MKYFKNTELATLYHISDKTIRNWIEASKQKKLPLDLYEEGGRVYIQDNEHNQAVLNDLVLERRKYQNKRSRRVINPTQEFYELFTHEQIDDIINELDKNQRLPIKYKYFGEGATYWDQYLTELYQGREGNLLTNTIEVLDSNLGYLDAHTRPYKNINVINLCVGNSLSMRGVLEHFKATGKLKRFVMLDLSKAMLDISENNIRQWFGDQLNVEKYIKDLAFERFGHILASDSFGVDASQTINLVFLVVGSIVNFPDPQSILQTIHSSIRKEDLVITTLKRDTEQTRKFFNFNTKGFSGTLNPHDALLLKLLGIDESLYELRQVFSEARKIRGIQIVLNKDLCIQFKMDRFHKRIELRKGQMVPIWWSWHHSDQDIISRFTSASFEVQHMTKSQDDQLIMLVARSMPISKGSHLLSP